MPKPITIVKTSPHSSFQTSLNSGLGYFLCGCFSVIMIATLIILIIIGFNKPTTIQAFVFVP